MIYPARISFSHVYPCFIGVQATEERLLLKQAKVTRVQSKVTEHRAENARLAHTVAQLQHAVAERDNIWKIRRKCGTDYWIPLLNIFIIQLFVVFVFGMTSEKDESGDAKAQKRRLNAVVERRRLSDLARAQVYLVFNMSRDHKYTIFKTILVLFLMVFSLTKFDSLKPNWSVVVSVLFHLSNNYYHWRWPQIRMSILWFEDNNIAITNYY